MLISNTNLSPLAVLGQIVEVVVAEGDAAFVELRIRANPKLRDALRADQETANASPAPEFETPVVVDPYRRRLWN